MGSKENGFVFTISGGIDQNTRNRYRKYDGFWKNMRSYCREYCDYTGIHGFKYFGERRSLFEKICWVIIFISSLIVCIGVIYKTYIKWQFSPVIVNFASEEQNIYKIPFPAVTICHEVKISRSFYNYSRNLKAVADKENLSSEDLKKLQYMSLVCSEGKMFFDKIPKINITDEGFYRFLEKGAAEFFDKCTWMGNVYPCYEIFQPIVTDEGLCMTFNMLNKEDLFRDVVDPPPIIHKSYLYKAQTPEDWTVGYGYGELADVETFPRRALLAGSANALIVNLNVSMDDLDYGCTSFQGFQVVLHKAVRFPTVQQHYFRVPLKKSVIVAISPTQLTTSEDVKDYSLAKRKCYFQSEKKLKYFKHYTQFNCKLECLTNLTLRRCGCVAFYMPRRNNTPICGNGNLLCMKNVRNNMDMAGLEHSINKENNKLDNFDSRLKCDCAPMCASVEYNVEITEIDYDWYKEFEALGYGKLDDELYSKSQLVIYFKSSHFIPYERNELYGHLDFLANVGGLLGLFVGFSLLSFFEIVYFLSLRIICNLTLYKNWHGKENK